MTVASQPDNDSRAPQLTVPQAIANLKQTEDTSDRYYAAWWLGRFRVEDPEAILALLEALQDENDRAPDGGFPLRRNAARALGKVGKDSAMAEQVVTDLIECLACSDYYVREAAAQSLEQLGAQKSIEPLSTLLDGGLEAAVAVLGKPHLVQPYNAVLEALGGLGSQVKPSQPKSPLLIETIEPFLAHEMPQVKNAAARAMYQLTDNADYLQGLVATLECDDLQLRRSALLDLGELGYLPAADAIANTLAENSIKLISLKGVLEKEIQESKMLTSGSACEVMDLMDSLL